MLTTKYLERGSSFAGSMKSCFSFSNDLAFTPSDNFTDTWYSRIVPKISSIFPIWRNCFKCESCLMGVIGQKGRPVSKIINLTCVMFSR